MRVLLATDFYAPFIGGGHRWAELTAHGLTRRGHEVTVLTEWHGGMARQEEDRGVPVRRVRQMRTVASRWITDPRQRHSPPFPDPVSVVEAGRVVRESAPEIALCFGWLTASVAPALVRARIPMLLSAHDYGYVCPTRIMYHGGRMCSGPAPRKCLGCASDFYGSAGMGGAAVAGVALAQPLLRRAIHGLQTVSRVVDRVNWDHLLAGRALDRDVPRFVIPSFLDTDPPGRGSTPAALRAFLDQLPSEPFIMFAGALRRIKGVDVLLEAYASLAEPRPPLVLMGTRHEDTPTVLPPGARIFESVPHDAVMASWARALVGVVPSVWPEPNATVSFECASQGVPVIVSEPSGMVDAFGDGAGLTVPAGSVQALANALRTVIDDPALRRRLGEAAKEASARFQADVVLAEQEHALATVLAGAGRRG